MPRPNRDGRDADTGRTENVDATEGRPLAVQVAEWQAIYDSIPVGLCLVDENLRYVRINRWLARLNGLPPEAHVGRTVREVLPDLADLIEPQLRRVFETGEPMMGVEFGGRAPATGEHRVWHQDLMPLRDASGRVIGINIVAKDVTDRRRRQDFIRQAEREYRHKADAAPAILWFADKDGKALFLSRRWYELTGQDVGAGLGDGWLEMIHPDDRTEVARVYDEAKQNRISFEIDFRVRSRDGEYRWGLGAGRPYFDREGRFNGLVGSVFDITERKHAEDALRESQRRLREINETLEQRVAERTADVTTRARQLAALAAQLTEAEQRERRRLAEILHDDLQQVLVAARMELSVLDAPNAEAHRQHLIELMNEAIAISRSLTADLSPPVVYEGDLNAALQWLAERMRQRHKLEVELVLDGDQPIDLNTRLFVFQAVREMLFNVVKHAGVQTARVRAQVRGRDLVVEVEDDGKGFDPEALQPGGGDDGFGLFSLRERANWLGGHLALNSKPGGPTLAQLCLPLRVQPAIVAPALPPERKPAPRKRSHEKVRVLVADDHDLMREGLAELLRGEDSIEVVGQAENGAVAVELAHTLHPDVVLMDVTMPVLNGMEATQRIRREVPGVRVIGLSMHDDPNIAAMMLKAGADGYLTKGGPSRDLIDTVLATHNGEHHNVSMA